MLDNFPTPDELRGLARPSKAPRSQSIPLKKRPARPGPVGWWVARRQEKRLNKEEKEAARQAYMDELLERAEEHVASLKSRIQEVAPYQRHYDTAGWDEEMASAIAIVFERLGFQTELRSEYQQMGKGSDDSAEYGYTFWRVTVRW